MLGSVLDFSREELERAERARWCASFAPDTPPVLGRRGPAAAGVPQPAAQQPRGHARTAAQLTRGHPRPGTATVEVGVEDTGHGHDARRVRARIVRALLLHQGRAAPGWGSPCRQQILQAHGGSLAVPEHPRPGHHLRRRGFPAHELHSYLPRRAALRPARRHRRDAPPAHRAARGLRAHRQPPRDAEPTTASATSSSTSSSAAAQRYPDTVKMNAAVEEVGGNLNGVTTRDHGYYYTPLHPDAPGRGHGRPRATCSPRPRLTRHGGRAADHPRGDARRGGREGPRHRPRQPRPSGCSSETTRSRSRSPGTPRVGVGARRSRRCSEHFARHYVAGNMVVAAAGPVRTREVLALAERALRAAARRARARARRRRRDPARARASTSSRTTRRRPSSASTSAPCPSSTRTSRRCGCCAGCSTTGCPRGCRTSRREARPRLLRARGAGGLPRRGHLRDRRRERPEKAGAGGGRDLPHARHAVRRRR